MSRKIRCCAVLAACCLPLAGCLSWPGLPHSAIDWEFRVRRPGFVTGSPPQTMLTSANENGLLSLDHQTALGMVRGLPDGPGGPGAAMLDSRRFYGRDTRGGWAP